MMTGAILTLAFAVVGMRLVDVALLQAAVEPRAAYAPKPATLQFVRADIVDRNGVLQPQVCRPHRSTRTRVRCKMLNLRRGNWFLSCRS